MRAAGQREWILLCTLAPHLVAFAQDPAETTPEETLAQEESPPASRTFSLDVLDPFLEFETQIESREVEFGSPGSSSPERKDRATIFTESLGFTLDGFVADPEVLRFEGDFQFGLSQARYRESLGGVDRTDSDSGTLLEYDLSLDLFPSQPVSLHAYARRGRERIPRRFLPSLFERRDEAGASLQITTDATTTDLGFDWSDVRRTGNVSGEDDESRESSRVHLDHRWELSDDQRLRLTYDHDRDRSGYQGSRLDLDTRRDEARIEHQWAFGPDGRHEWDFLVRYNDEQGDLARDEIEVAPRFTFRHADRFKTTWRYNFYKVDQDALSTQQHKFDGAAAWDVTDHLRLTADAFWRYERVERDIETYEYGGQLGLRFERPTHWGTFTTDGSLEILRAETTGSGPTSVVRGETHALDTARPAILTRSDIERRSIRAYNAGRTRVFVEGLDYTATQTGRLTFLRRIISGNIADDEIVYCDYTYRVPTGSRTDTYQTALRIEHAFNGGLTPYYHWLSRKQFVDEPDFRRPFASDIFEPAFDAFADNTDHHRMGVRYEKDRWSMSGEFEIFNDSVLPYEAWHVTGQLALVRTLQHSIDATAEYSHYRFDGDFDRRRVNWIDLDLSHRMELTDELSTSAAMGYRLERDSRDGTTHGVDLEGTVRLSRGLLDVELTAEYDLLSIGADDERGYGVWLNVRRDLSDAWGRGERR